ncbi:MAG: GerMN domain-containing protein, partial [Chloroflexota bacterium]|nr:GerMN domain-containing protein [Chloroflexota bacterium]
APSPSSAAAAPSTPPTAAAASSPSPSAAPKTEQAKLYFSADGKLVTESASVSAAAPANGALKALFGGPKMAGHFTEIPKDARLLDVSIKDEVGYVSLSKDFFASGGSLGMQLRLAQVVYTMTQFPGVKSVQLLQEGQIIPVAGGEGFPVGKPLTRQSFPGLAA